MSNLILRPKDARVRLGVAKTHFDENFVHRDDADASVPGTGGTVPRLRPVPLGIRAIGFFSDEIDKVIEALRGWRDQQAATPRPPQRSTARRARPPRSGARR
jgi:hypothetical protein